MFSAYRTTIVRVIDYPKERISLNKNVKTSSRNTAWEQVNLAGAVADLKDQQYRILLAYSSLLELLIAKGILSMEEFEAAVQSLDLADEPLVRPTMPASLLHPKA
jgi:hypothetical protein